ncbi:MAG: hypothetical protein ACRCX4_00350 [Bacteroidales bacterium]
MTINIETETGNPNPKEKRKANPDKNASGFNDAHSKVAVEGADI